MATRFIVKAVDGPASTTPTHTKGDIVWVCNHGAACVGCRNQIDQTQFVYVDVTDGALSDIEGYVVPKTTSTIDPTYGNENIVIDFLSKYYFAGSTVDAWVAAGHGTITLADFAAGVLEHL